MGIKTQNQERAKFILEKIEDLKKSSYAEKLPAFILTNGLLPTLAFLNSKQDGRNLYHIIENYLINKFHLSNMNKDIIEFLANSDASILRIATKEIMELANWIKRLVEGEEKKD